MKHRPALDGVRGLAILLVLGFHGGLLPGGYVGVDVFFTLSGFLITSMLIHDHANGRWSMRRFYRRRAARIVPAFLVGVAVSLVMLAAAGSPRLGIQSLAAVGYVTNILAAKVGGTHVEAFRWAWSLSLEEQFYLLWPAVLLALLGLGRKRAALIVGGCALAVMLGRDLLAGPQWSEHGYFIMRGDGLLLGAALALSGLRTRHGWLGWPLVFLAAVVPISAAASPRAAVPIAVVGSALLIAGNGSGLACRPLRYLGRISYALYIWDSLLVTMLHRITGDIFPHGAMLWLWLTSSLLAAHVSTVLLEEPLRRRLAHPQPVARHGYVGGVRVAAHAE